MAFPVFLGEDEVLDEILVEDREEELRHHHSSQAETRKLVRDTMQMDWGRGEVVHPEKAKELILQVTPFSCLFFNLNILHLAYELAHSFSSYLIFFFLFCIFRVCER